MHAFSLPLASQTSHSQVLQYSTLRDDVIIWWEGLAKKLFGSPWRTLNSLKLHFISSPASLHFKARWSGAYLRRATSSLTQAT